MGIRQKVFSNRNKLGCQTESCKWELKGGRDVPMFAVVSLVGQSAFKPR